MTDAEKIECLLTLIGDRRMIAGQKYEKWLRKANDDPHNVMPASMRDIWQAIEVELLSIQREVKEIVNEQ